ncbi:MAG: hypothetical protein PWQ57_1893 [Desulfovibrionales bacterium]|nr:hypothetical protein [Desulfovibrionales bacterium]
MLTRMLKAQAFKQAQQLFAQGKVQEATELLEHLQEEYVTLCDENKALRSQLSEVAEVLDMSEHMEFDGQKYWINEENERKGPFCQICYDRDGLLIRLQERSRHFLCHGCGSHYPRADSANGDATPEAQVQKRVVSLFK